MTYNIYQRLARPPFELSWGVSPVRPRERPGDAIQIRKEDVSLVSLSDRNSFMLHWTRSLHCMEMAVSVYGGYQSEDWSPHTS